MTDLPHWTAPPSEDSLLAWYFCHSSADIGFGSTHQPFVNMATSGIMGGGSTLSDDRIVRKGVVGCRDEPRESAAAKIRRVEAALSKLSTADKLTLWMRYGPNVWTPQMRARLGDKAGLVLTDTEVIAQAEAAKVPAVQWVMLKDKNDEPKRKLIAEAQGRGAQRLRAAWNAWADARGRRRRGAYAEGLARLDEAEERAGR